MKLDFNETNILVQALEDLEKKPKTAINKTELISYLYLLRQNTDEKYNFLRASIKTLAFKIENLSEKSLKQIRADKENNKIIATICYTLPET